MIFVDGTSSMYRNKIAEADGKYSVRQCVLLLSFKVNGTFHS